MPQTNVDKLVEQLELISNATFDNWRYTTDFTLDVQELSRPDYDDAHWRPLKINEHIYPDSCWLRKVIELPEYIGGLPVQGRIKFLVSVDDYGYFYLDGKNLGHFPWNGEFVLTEEGRPGMRFVILIKAVNTGGPLRLLRARLDFAEDAPVRQLTDNLILSMKVGQKLLSFDTYQTNERVRVDPGIDRSKMDAEEKRRLNERLQSLAARIDVDALGTGDVARFEASVEAIRDDLQPVAEFAKHFTLHFVANAHIDAAWLWRKRETVEVCHRTFDSVTNLFEARPDFTYAQSQAVFYAWMQERYPELFAEMQAYVESGRWEVVGGMWVEPDCNMPDGPSWARHFLYAQRYFEEHLGRRATIGWNPDSFGYTWNMPQFLLSGGTDVFITQKIGWNDTNVFPYRVFWWEASDGSRILTYFPFSYVNEVSNPFQLVDWLRQFEANTGFTNLMVLFGVGDHGGGPSLEMMQRIDRLREMFIYPSIEFGTAEKYLSWLKLQDLSEVPTWRDELYLEYHRGTYTTQAKTKAWNRRTEVLLTNAEKFGALAHLYGREYPGADVKRAWKRVLFNQFHDILPGSSIREVYFDAEEDYQEAHAIGSFHVRRSLEHLSRRINTAFVKEGKPVVVFNPLAWSRTDLVHLELPEGDAHDYAIFDADGRERPSQTVRIGTYRRAVLFVAEEVPSLGYRVYELRQQAPGSFAGELEIAAHRVENAFFRVVVDPNSGWIQSIVDRRHDREVLSGHGNRLQLLEDKPDAWDAWNIGLTGVEYPSTFRGIEVVERGPVRAVLRVHRDFLKPGVEKWHPTEDFPTSFFTQDIILYRGLDRIEFRTTVDWWEDKTMLKVAFPVTVADTVATYEIPYGTIQRSTTLEAPLDKGQWEVPALRWADLSADGYGVSLLNRAKYGYDIKGRVMRLSLLRSPEWPDPTADRGKHSIEYALYPHARDWGEANTVRRGYEYNAPLLAVMAEAHGGELPARGAFVEVSPENVILSTIKQAEDSEAWVVQVYETGGRAGTVRIKLPRPLTRAVRCNFLEEEGVPLSVQGRVIELPIRAREVATAKIYF